MKRLVCNARDHQLPNHPYCRPQRPRLWSLRKRTKQRWVVTLHNSSAGTLDARYFLLQSFSRLWVEFLLTEAAAGESPSKFNTSLPGTPTQSPNNLPSPSNAGSPRLAIGGMRRLASLGASMSSPNLHNPSPPPPLPPIPSVDKGKGKDLG